MDLRNEGEVGGRGGGGKERERGRDEGGVEGGGEQREAERRERG
mgnify:CR=1 FL=1